MTVKELIETLKLVMKSLK